MHFEPGFALIGGVIEAIAGVLFFFGHRHRSKGKRIDDTPTTPIRNVGEGFVEVVGRAQGSRELLASPLSGQACVAYRFVVEEKITRTNSKGESSSHWRTIVTDVQNCGLMVKDASQASIAVNLDAAELVLKTDRHARSGFLNDASPELEETLRTRYGTSSTGLVFNKTMRYSETLVEEDDELYVLGTAQLQGDALVIDKGNDLFIVSDSAESTLSSRYHRNGIIFWVVGGLLGVAGLAVGLLSVLSDRL